MAVTKNTYTGDGSTRNFSFSFSYLDQSHVKTTINGTPIETFTFFNASTIRFDTAPPNGAAVVIYRETPSDNLLVDYSPGSALREADLEKNLQQILNVSQETQTFAADQSTAGLQEQITTANVNASSALTVAAAALSTSQSASNLASSFGERVSDLETASDSQATQLATTTTTASAAQASATEALSRVDTVTVNAFKNFITNSSFLIAERANGTTATGWVFDRWYAAIAGSSATISRGNVTVGEPLLPAGTTRFLRTVVTSVAGASNRVAVFQRIPNVRTLANSLVNVSFYARADFATQIAVELSQNFGTGGSPSSSVSTGGTKFSIGTTWQRYSAIFSLPSVSGKTIGSNNDSGIDLTFFFDAGSSWNFQSGTLGQASKAVDLTCLQLELGGALTSYQEKGFMDELRLCQRFWERMVPTHSGYQAANATTTLTLPFRVPKFRTPTPTWNLNSSLDLTSINYSIIDTQLYSINAVKNGTTGVFNFNATAQADCDFF